MPNNTIIDFSDNGAILRVRNRQLVIEIQGTKETTSIPLCDIAVILISHPSTVITHAVLSGIAEYGGILVTCGINHMPVGLYTPCVGNSLQTERALVQASAAGPTLKRAWQQIVQAKLQMQAYLLTDVTGNDAGLLAMADQVNSGDTDNKEAQGARRYWRSLFGNSFRRDSASSDSVNISLNYGYAVLRSVVARSIFASGLHPSLGLHHHNKYNPFCLADDLMEPYRPVIDREVVRLHQSGTQYKGLPREVKRSLIEVVKREFHVSGNRCTIFDAALRLTQSLIEFYGNPRLKLRVFS